VLYLIDSILKNIKNSTYHDLFKTNIVTLFAAVFEKVSIDTQLNLIKLPMTCLLFGCGGCLVLYLLKQVWLQPGFWLKKYLKKISIIWDNCCSSWSVWFCLVVIEIFYVVIVAYSINSWKVVIAASSNARLYVGEGKSRMFWPDPAHGLCSNLVPDQVMSQMLWLIKITIFCICRTHWPSHKHTLHK